MDERDDTTQAVEPSAESTAESEAPRHPYEKCSCLRCGLDWKARNPDHRPASCPRCGSARWDIKPMRKGARRPEDPPNPNWQYRLKPIKRKCPTCGKPMTRLTVQERKELDAKEDDQHAAAAEEAAMERPARPSATTGTFMLPGREGTLPRDVVPRRMTPPPGMITGQPETPETQATRRSTLSEELKEKS